MRVLLSVLVLAILCVPACDFSMLQPDPAVRTVEVSPAVIEHANNTWCIESKHNKGSAFPIASRFDGSLWHTLFLSAGHCQDKTTKVYIFECGDQTVFGKLRSAHKSLDAGLWEVISDKAIPVLPLSWDLLPFGARLYMSGYPLGRHLALSDGFQSADFGWMTADLVPGNSGGPVMDDKGRVIGVATSYAAITLEGQSHPLPHVSGYTPLFLVQPWLESHLKAFKTL